VGGGFQVASAGPGRHLLLSSWLHAQVLVTVLWVWARALFQQGCGSGLIQSGLIQSGSGSSSLAQSGS
jgi:hypothetical protein